MAILAELLLNNPSAIMAEDFQPLLSMLVDFQSNIQHSVQIKICIKIVKILLLKENVLKKDTTIISETFLNEQWCKMAELAFRNSATNSSTSLENLTLLKHLIDHKKMASTIFLETVINAVLTNSIKKSNSSIDLLISIFRSFNVDLFKNATEIRVGIINWLSPRIKASDLKSLLANDGHLALNLVGELYALCVLSKAEKFSIREYNEIINSNEFSVYIKQLEYVLQCQTMRKLIVVECSNEIKTEKNMKEEQLPDSNSIQTTIIETYYTELEKALRPDDEFKMSDNPFEDFVLIANSLATYLHVLNTFLKYKSMDADKYTKSFLTKRILIKIEHLNMIAERFLSLRQEPKDIFDILEKLLLIVNPNLSLLLRDYVLGQRFNIMLIKWLSKQVKPIQMPDSQYFQMIKHENELSFEHKIQVKTLCLLTNFSKFDEENETAAFDAISNYAFNFSSIEDLYVIFEIIKVSLVFQIVVGLIILY